MDRSVLGRLALVGVTALGAAGLAACNGLPVQTAAPSTTPATIPEAPFPSTTQPSSGATPTTIPGSSPATTSPSTLPAITRTRPGSALLHLVLADATAKRWVQAVSTSPPQAAGDAPTTFHSADGPDRGTQEISVGAVTGDIRVIGNRTYIRGTPEALIGLFGVPSALATRLSDEWVRLKPGDSEYKSVTAGVTISSFLGEMDFNGTVTEGTATLGSTTATVIEGPVSTSAGGGTGALYVTGTAKPLPLAWEQIGTDGSTETTFGDWGGAVKVTVPAGAVPLPAPPAGTATVAGVPTG